MAYYTTQPLPPIDTLNDHSGFVALAVICFFLALFITAWLTDDMHDSGTATIIVFVIVYSLMLAYPAYVSWHTGEIKTYANVPVQAELLGTYAEVQRYEYREGKSNRDVTSRYKYVIYRTPDGDVTFEAGLGIAYPRVATLYKN